MAHQSLYSETDSMPEEATGPRRRPARGSDRLEEATATVGRAAVAVHDFSLDNAGLVTIVPGQLRAGADKPVCL